MGILAFSSVSANDLNETDASQVNGDYELDFTDSSEKLETGEVETLQEEPKNITVRDKTFAGITNAINSANDGDTIILDGKYDQEVKILNVIPPNSDNNPRPYPFYYMAFDGLNINKKLNFLGINNAVLNGNIDTPNAPITLENYNYFVKINSEGVSFKNITFTYSKGVSALTSSYGCSIDNCTFIDNEKFGTYEINNGACINLNNCVNANISNTKFISNAAKNYGGAIYISGNSYIGIHNCYFEGNSASNAGAIFVQDSSQCEIFNCYFKKNSASKGAAIYGGSVESCTFNGHGSNVLFGTSNVLNCIFDVYPTVAYHYNSILTINNSATDLDFDDFLVINISDIRGQLTGRTLNLIIDGKRYNISTDSNGIAELKFRDYIFEPGPYSISVNFEGDQNNYAISKNFNVVLKSHSFLDVNDLSIVKGDAGRLYVTLSNAAGPLTDKAITFFSNGKRVNIATGSNGMASLNINYLGLTDFGKYDVCVSFEGDENYHPVSKNVTVCINNYEGNLTANLNGNYYNDSILEFNLVNSRTKKPISNALIRVMLSNGENVTLTTDLNGIVSYPICFAPGQYSFNASVVDVNADVNSLEQDFVINDIVAIFEVSQNGTGYNESNLVVKLYNPNTNHAYKNIKINLQFNTGDFTEIITNDEGIAVYHIPFIPGIYDGFVNVISPHVHADRVEIEDITIEKSDADVIFSNEIIFSYGDTGYTNLTVIGGSVDKISVIGYPDIALDFNNNVVSVAGLGIGHYLLNVTVNPDSYHNPTYKTLNITVVKSFSDVIAKDIVFDYGDSGSTTLNIIGGVVFKDNVTVLGHDNVNLNLDNNVVTVSGLDAGNYKLQIITTPDNSHSSVTKLFNITVNRIDSSVNGGNIVFDYLSSGSAVLNVVGGSVASVNVVGYDNIATLDGNVVTVSGLNAGNYTLQVTTSPDANHNAITDSNIKIIVNKIDSSVIGDRITFDYGSSGSATVTVVGGSISKAEIVGYSGKTRVEGNKVMVSGLDAGDYTLQITTAPYSNYNSVNGSIEVSVNRVDSSFNFAKNLISFTSDSYGFVSLENVVGGSFDPSNMSVSGSNAVISYGDNGNVVVVSGLAKGDYYLSVTLIPDANHNPVTKTIPVKVTDSTTPIIPGTNAPSTIEIAPITFYYGGSGSSDVTVAGGTVEPSGISIDGHPEVKPDLVGNKIVVSGLAVGTYTLRVSTTPYDGFYSVTKTVSITVKKISAAIKASSWADYSKSTKKWTVKLVNSNTNKPLANMQVVLKVYKGSKLEKTLKYKTNSKGEISLKPSSWSVGKRTVKISFTKTGYDCKSVSKTVNVLKQTKVKYTVKTVPRKDGTSVSIWIKIGKKPIKKGVKFNIYVPKRKKPVTVVTGTFNKVNKGFVGYGTNLLSAGTHKITIKPVGFKYTGSKTIKIKIKKGANKYKKSETIISKGKLQTILKG